MVVPYRARLRSAKSGALWWFVLTDREYLVNDYAFDYECVERAPRLLLPARHNFPQTDEAFRRSLSPRATVPDHADPTGPIPQGPVWTSGGDDRPAAAKVVDAFKDVVPDFLSASAQLPI